MKMSRYITGIIATAIGLALLVTSSKISNYLYSWYLYMGGLTLPYISRETTNMIMKTFFGIILIFVSLEIIVNGWRR